MHPIGFNPEGFNPAGFSLSVRRTPAASEVFVMTAGSRSRRDGGDRLGHSVGELVGLHPGSHDSFAQFQPAVSSMVRVSEIGPFRSPLSLA